MNQDDLLQMLATQHLREFDPEYESKQLSLLRSIPATDKLWFQTLVGVGGWSFPDRFMVDSELQGQRDDPDPKVADLFERVVRDYTEQRLSLDQFGIALQKLAKRSTAAEFEQFRSVLGQKMVPPCSPLIWNRVSPEHLQLPVPEIARLVLYVPEQIKISRRSLLIEEYLGQRRLFVEPNWAYDDLAEPDPLVFDLWHRFVPSDPSLRYEIFEGQHELTLRDVSRTTDHQHAGWGLEDRRGRVEAIFDQIESLDVNLIDRKLIEPENLVAEIDVYRQCGFPGFTVIRPNGDGVVFLFERNAGVTVDENFITLQQDALNPEK